MIERFAPDCEFEPGWLVRDDTVLASLELAANRAARAKGLLGRGRVEGVLALPNTRSVHSVTLGFDLDVAFLDSSMTVIRTVRLGRNRVTFPVWRSKMAIEAEAGAFGRWNLSVGDVLEIRPVEPRHDDLRQFDSVASANGECKGPDSSGRSSDEVPGVADLKSEPKSGSEQL